MPRRPQPGRDMPPRGFNNSLLPFGMSTSAIPHYAGHAPHSINRGFYEDPYDSGKENGRRIRAQFEAGKARQMMYKAMRQPHRPRQHGVRGGLPFPRGIRSPYGYSRPVMSPLNRYRPSHLAPRVPVRPMMPLSGGRRAGGLIPAPLPHRSPFIRRPAMPISFLDRRFGTPFLRTRGLPPMQRNVRRPSYPPLYEDDEDDYEDDEYDDDEFDDDEEDDGYSYGGRGAFGHGYSSWGYDRSDDEDEYAYDDGDEDGLSSYTPWYGRQQQCGW